MTSALDIRPDHLEIVRGILHRLLPSDVRVWAFGSRAKSEAWRASDLDLALEGAGPIDLDTVISLKIAFDDSDLPYTVDIVDLRTTSDSFRKIIDAQKIRFPLADGQA